MSALTDVAVDDDAAATVVPQWVVFACGEHRFAVQLEHVREILDPPGYTRIPGCGRELCGLIALRGRIITVIDFAAAHGLPPAARLADHALLLLERGEGLAGLAVERVLGVAHGVDRSLPLSGAALKALDSGREDVLGIGEFAGVPFTALDPGPMLARLLP
jgi:purine-binding chemotaxis protein CheW